jgi:hypothetical protein
MPADSTELDELDSLLTSGGWGRLTAHFDSEWGLAGQSYQEAIKRAIGGPVGSEAEAVHRLKCVTFAQTEIARFMQWPAERVAQIRGQMERVVAGGGTSRRGPGL